MKKDGLERLSGVLIGCLRITFAAGGGITVFLYFLLQRYKYYLRLDGPYDFWVYMVVLTLSGVSALVILWQLIDIMKTVHQQNPFVYRNVRCLQTISLFCYVISVLFLILLVLKPSIFTFIIGYVFLVGGFTCLVLGKVFQKAVNYKTENDLTV